MTIIGFMFVLFIGQRKELPALQPQIIEDAIILFWDCPEKKRKAEKTVDPGSFL